MHHINGDVSDTRPGNLVICRHDYHMAVFHSPVSNPGGFVRNKR